VALPGAIGGLAAQPKGSNRRHPGRAEDADRTATAGRLLLASYRRFTVALVRRHRLAPSGCALLTAASTAAAAA
jgi:hypothetical protein